MFNLLFSKNLSLKIPLALSLALSNFLTACDESGNAPGTTMQSPNGNNDIPYASSLPNLQLEPIPTQSFADPDSSIKVAIVTPIDSTTPTDSIAPTDVIENIPFPNVAVPEPLTILGAAIAVSFGVGFKRKLANKDNNT